jgi:HTH-type transcriptional regulator/antitoxin HigA
MPSEETGMSIATFSDAYLALIRRFPLRPIRTNSEVEAAEEILDELDARRADLGPEERDYCDALGILIEHYEDEHYPIGDIHGADLLRVLIEDRMISQADVVRGTGIRDSALSEILSGKRKMGLKVIQRLAEFFGVDPSSFLPSR